MSLPPLDWTEAAPESPAAAAIPWENGELPVLTAMGRTIFEINWRPRLFFQRLPSEGGLSDPLGFALLLGSLGLLAPFCWQLLWPEAADGLILSKILEKLTAPPADALVLVVFFFLIPLVVAGEQFFLSLFLAAAGKLLRKDFTFEAAFRLLAYSNAAFVFSLIPWVGFWFAGVYHFVLLIQGLHWNQQYSYWQILVILLLSLFLQFLAFSVVLLLVGAWLFWSFLSLFLS